MITPGYMMGPGDPTLDDEEKKLLASKLKDAANSVALPEDKPDMSFTEDEVYGVGDVEAPMSPTEERETDSLVASLAKGIDEASPTASGLTGRGAPLQPKGMRSTLNGGPGSQYASQAGVQAAAEKAKSIAGGTPEGSGRTREEKLDLVGRILKAITGVAGIGLTAAGAAKGNVGLARIGQGIRGAGGVAGGAFSEPLKMKQAREQQDLENSLKQGTLDVQRGQLGLAERNADLAAQNAERDAELAKQKLSMDMEKARAQMGEMEFQRQLSDPNSALAQQMRDGAAQTIALQRGINLEQAQTMLSGLSPEAITKAVLQTQKEIGSTGRTDTLVGAGRGSGTAGGSLGASPDKAEGADALLWTIPKSVDSAQRKALMDADLAGRGIMQKLATADAAAKSVAQKLKDGTYSRADVAQWIASPASAPSDVSLFRQAVTGGLLKQKDLDEMGALTGADLTLESLQIPQLGVAELINTIMSGELAINPDAYNMAAQAAASEMSRAAGAYTNGLIDVSADEIYRKAFRPNRSQLETARVSDPNVRKVRMSREQYDSRPEKFKDAKVVGTAEDGSVLVEIRK